MGQGWSYPFKKKTVTYIFSMATSPPWNATFQPYIYRYLTLVLEDDKTINLDACGNTKHA